MALRYSCFIFTVLPKFIRRESEGGRVSLYIHSSPAKGSLLGLDPHWQGQLAEGRAQRPLEGPQLGLQARPVSTVSGKSPTQTASLRPRVFPHGGAGVQAQGPSSCSISLGSTSFSLGFPVPWPRDTSSASSFSQSEKETGRTPKTERKTN